MSRLRNAMWVFPLLMLLLPTGAIAIDDAIVKIDAKRSAGETFDSLNSLIEQNGFTVFWTHDHGDETKPRQVVAFGKPRHSTRIMWHDPAAGVELPLRIAVFQGDDNVTRIIYRRPSSLRDSYTLDECRLLDKLDVVMAEMTQAAAQ